MRKIERFLLGGLGSKEKPPRIDDDLRLDFQRILSTTPSGPDLRRALLELSEQDKYQGPYPQNEIGVRLDENGYHPESLPLFYCAALGYQTEGQDDSVKKVSVNFLSAIRKTSQEGIRLQRTRRKPQADNLFRLVVSEGTNFVEQVDSESTSPIATEVSTAEKWLNHAAAGFRPKNSHKRKKQKRRR